MMSGEINNDEICEKLNKNNDTCLYVIDGLPVYRSKDFPVYQLKPSSRNFLCDLHFKLLSGKCSKNLTKNNYLRLPNSQHKKHRSVMRQIMELKGLRKSCAVKTDTREKITKTKRKNKKNCYGRPSSFYKGYKLIGQKRKPAVQQDDLANKKTFRRHKKHEPRSDFSYSKVTTHESSSLYFDKTAKQCVKRINHDCCNSYYPLLIDTNFPGGIRTTYEQKNENQKINPRKRIKNVRSRTDKCRCLHCCSSESIYTSLLDNTLYSKNDKAYMPILRDFPASNHLRQKYYRTDNSLYSTNLSEHHSPILYSKLKSQSHFYGSEISIFNKKENLHVSLKRCSKITLTPQNFQPKLKCKRSIRTQVTVKRELKKQRPKYQNIQSHYKAFAHNGGDTNMNTMDSEKEIRTVDFCNSYGMHNDVSHPKHDNLNCIQSFHELKFKDISTMRKCRRLKHRHVTLVKTPMRPLMLSPHSATQLLCRKNKTFKVKQSKSAVSTRNQKLNANNDKEPNFIRNNHDRQQSGDDRNLNKNEKTSRKEETQKHNTTSTPYKVQSINKRSEVTPQNDDNSCKLKHTDCPVTSNSNTSVDTNITPLQAIKRFVKYLMREVNQNKTPISKNNFAQTCKLFTTTKNQVSEVSLIACKYRNAYVQHNDSTIIMKNLDSRKNTTTENGTQCDKTKKGISTENTRNQNEYYKYEFLNEYNGRQQTSQSNTSIATNITPLQAIKRYINQLRSENNQKKKRPNTRKIITRWLDYGSDKCTKYTNSDKTSCIYKQYLEDMYSGKIVTKANQTERKNFKPIHTAFKNYTKFYNKHNKYNKYNNLTSNSCTSIATNTTMTRLQAIRRYISQIMLDINSTKAKTKLKRNTQINRITKTPHILSSRYVSRNNISNGISVSTQTGNKKVTIGKQRQYKVRTISIHKFANQNNTHNREMIKQPIYNKNPLSKCGFSLHYGKPQDKIFYKLKPTEKTDKKCLTSKYSNLNNDNDISKLQNKPRQRQTPIKLNRNNISPHINQLKGNKGDSEIIYPKIINSQCYTERISSSENKYSLETYSGKEKNYFRSSNNIRNYETYFSKVTTRPAKHLCSLSNQDLKKQYVARNICKHSLNSLNRFGNERHDICGVKIDSKGGITNKRYHCSLNTLKCSDAAKIDHDDGAVQVSIGNNIKKCNCSLNSLRQLNVSKEDPGCKMVKLRRCNCSNKSHEQADRSNKNSCGKIVLSKSSTVIKQKRCRKHYLSTSSFGKSDERARSKHRIDNYLTPKKRFCGSEPMIKNESIGDGSIKNVVKFDESHEHLKYRFVSKSSKMCTKEADTSRTKSNTKVTQYEKCEIHEENLLYLERKIEKLRKLCDFQFLSNSNKPVYKNTANCKLIQCDVKDSKSFTICLRCRRNTKSKNNMRLCECLEKFTSTVKRKLKCRKRKTSKTRKKNLFCEYPKLKEKLSEIFKKPSGSSCKLETVTKECMKCCNCKCPKCIAKCKISQICNAPSTSSFKRLCLKCRATFNFPRIRIRRSLCSVKSSCCKCAKCIKSCYIPQSRRSICSSKKSSCKAKHGIPKTSRRQPICSCPKTFILSRLFFRSKRYLRKGFKKMKIRSSTTYFNVNSNAWYLPSSLTWGTYVKDTKQKRDGINCYDLSQRSHQPYSFCKSLSLCMNAFCLHLNMITRGVAYFSCFIFTLLVWCPFIIVSKLLCCCCF